jgi:hypothetical protein
LVPLQMTGDKDGPRSNPYRPASASCCEKCVFGTGEHPWWCAESWVDLLDPSPLSRSYEAKHLRKFIKWNA